MNNIIEFPKIDENTIMCDICKIRTAKWLCDFETGYIFDAPNERGIKTPIQKSTCSRLLCDKCTHKINKKDYCPQCYKKLNEE